MDIRTYLSLEAALSTKLMKSWAKVYSEKISSLEGLLISGEYGKARELVQDFDLTDLGAKNKQLLTFIYRASVGFGASTLSDSPTAQDSEKTQELVALCVSNTLQYLEHGGSVLWQDRLLQLIAQMESGKVAVEKAEKTRYVKPFVSFKEIADDTTQMATTLHMSRLATWGFCAEAEVTEVSRYKLSAVLDGRTSKFCRWIDGKEFSVEDARKKVLEVLQLQNPDDAKTVQPWPDQSKAGMSELESLTADELVARGLHIPPFHPGCRTLLVPVGGSVGRVGKPKVPESKQYLTAEKATVDTFKELGLNLTEEQVDHWNAYVGLNPTQWVSKLTGKSPLEVLESQLKSGSISVSSDGDIVTKLVGKTSALSYSTGLTFDPYAGKLYLNKLDFLAGSPKEEAAFVKTVLGGAVQLGETIGAASVSLAVGSYAYQYGKMGFLPGAVEWQKMRLEVMDSLVEGDLKEVLDSLLDDERMLLLNLLGNNDESAFKVILDLPWEFRGRPLGLALFPGPYGVFSLDLGGSLVAAKGYLQ